MQESVLPVLVGLALSLVVVAGVVIAAGRASSLRRIVDRSIGMYVVRRLTGRLEASPPDGDPAPPTPAPDPAPAARPTIRPTRLVLAGERGRAGERRPASGPRMRPSVVTPRRPVVRGRLVRDTSGILLAVAGVVLLTVLVVPPGGAVLGESAAPSFPAIVHLPSQSGLVEVSPGEPTQSGPPLTFPSESPEPVATTVATWTAPPSWTPPPQPAASARPGSTPAPVATATPRPPTSPPGASVPPSPSAAPPSEEPSPSPSPDPPSPTPDASPTPEPPTPAPDPPTPEPSP